MSSKDENSFDILTLARLANIDLGKEEEKTLQMNLSKIVDYMASLQIVDTNDTPPCTSVLEKGSDSNFEDRVGIPLDRDVFLANTPSQVGGMIRVPPVITY